MDFHKMLLDVDSALGPDELRASTFLCADILGFNPNSVETFTELFSSLMDRGLLSEDQPQLLAELLFTIQQHRLLKNIGLNNEEFLASNSISSYRKLLYELSESITDNDLKSMKFMLNTLVSRKKLEESSTTLDVFLDMERLDLINDSNLNQLEIIFSQICPILNEKIKLYKTQEANFTAHQPRSISFPSEPNQVSRPFQITGSFKEQGEPETSTNSSNSSDVTKEVKDLENLPSEETNEPPMTQEVNMGLGTYPMTATKRGICAILNNQDFADAIEPLKDRVGSEVDANRLKEVFEWLNFDVKMHLDCNAREMLERITYLSNVDHSEMDCLVCCVLSHGMEGVVYGVSGRTVKIKEMMEPFDGHRCPSLVGKPKIFFIQACQGTKDQRGVVFKDRKEEEEEDGICSDAKVTKTIPSGADFLLGMATVPTYVSYRDRQRGSWYIQSLCQNLIKFVPKNIDLVTILTQVNADVSEKTASGWKKQMPQPAFSLRKRVVFPIPTTPPPTI